MEKRIKQRWNDTKLQAIAERFGTSSKELTILDGFESFIYEYERDGHGYILRVSHSNRRSPDLIRGEVDWINYLAKGGARVAQAIESQDGNLVEPIDDGHGEQFLATAFVKAQGDHLSHKNWTDEFNQHYGETLGRIHHLSKSYTPSNPAWKRVHWDDRRYINLDEWSKTAELFMIEQARAIMGRLQAAPKDDSYHMIHSDAHGGNFFVDDQGQITLFDFDDCAFGPAIYDISMVIFYSPAHGKPELAESFTKHFLIGYARENQIDPSWLEYIPYFLKLREIDLYALIERDIDWRTEGEDYDVYFMTGRLERMKENLPTIDFDFTSLAYVLG